MVETGTVNQMIPGRKGEAPGPMKNSVPPVRTFSIHCRERYGEPVGKIAIDTGHVCPNRKYGGCIYCRPASFTPGYLLKNDSVEEQIKRGKAKLLKNRFRLYFAYFQQETCTAMEPDKLLGMAAFALSDPDCLGLILSTRPDYVQDNLLTCLAEMTAATGRACLFELGLQSVHDKSLRLLNRNHTFEDFTDALSRIKNAGAFEVGAHLIFGIPGETKEDMLASLETVCSMGIDSLKLHHLQVIRNTKLHEMFTGGEVQLFSLKEYTQFLLTALQIIPPQVVIHRLWASSHPDLLVAPRWEILATHLSRELHEKMKELKIYQGISFRHP